MPGNSFGQAFCITTAGESHGPAYVVIVDGVPPGIELSVDDLMVDLNRRRPGQSCRRRVEPVRPARPNHAIAIFTDILSRERLAARPGRSEYALVSRFRSSLDLAAPSDANFGIKGTRAPL